MLHGCGKSALYSMGEYTKVLEMDFFTRVKFIDTRYGFETRLVDFGVYFDGSDNGEGRKVVLDPLAKMPKLSEGRGNGWMEIEMGVFFNVTGEDGTVVCSVFGFDRSKSGIIIQGVELRPKSRR
ncbi:hypothetical protein WN943_029554 [Citrus x changshan-huyou]